MDVSTAYAFDNDSGHAVEQHRCLSEAYDPVTFARLAGTGVGAGWSCLEVGAGGSGVAQWLAARVAPTGTVLATDIKPHHIAPAPGLTVLRHDIVHDPLPQKEFDLVHTRLVLQHLPEREAVLRKLVRALKPGGWMQIDEFDISYGPVLLAPDVRAANLYETFLAAKEKAFLMAGGDGTWGRRAAASMVAAGLVDVDPVPAVFPWRAGSPGLELLIHHTHHLRDRLVAAGMTDGELAEVRAVMRDPGFRASSCVVYSVRGRRPA
ncbi:class I SAM-dependent methyltransferase [Amycolatopsis keratiniphila]|uniref:SAM-dependent methyltransferase n=1 Tax=Amycolatopsis keratiniphila subsp. keratiniphila TaxID=227715 RepID=A0A1W2M338_9PSEU|nr:class I SAM-dependent methyltransferase [Amycolatopsis keratiniphila]ONF74435.1 SAM-dependent methyltransferase [Amycolatopsis keratiniphila subsp. keratiniphila]